MLNKSAKKLTKLLEEIEKASKKFNKNAKIQIIEVGIDYFDVRIMKDEV